MGMGEAQGANAAMQALENALESPLLEDLDIKNAKGVILHFKHHPNFPFLQINEVGNHIQDMLTADVAFKYGESSNEDMAEDKIEITIIATGFEYQNEIKVAPKGVGNSIAKMVLKKTGTEDEEILINQLETPAILRHQMD